MAPIKSGAIWISAARAPNAWASAYVGPTGQVSPHPNKPLSATSLTSVVSSDQTWAFAIVYGPFFTGKSLAKMWISAIFMLVSRRNQKKPA